MNTKKINRKKRYYRKNQSKILASLKEKRKKARLKPSTFALVFRRITSLFLFQQWTEKLLLTGLILSCTTFLIAESMRTLQSTEGTGEFWKALLCELVLVGVSLLPALTRKTQILRSIILIGIIALTLLNTIGGPLSHFSQARQKTRLKAEESEILNRTIEQKQSILTRSMASNRISRARWIESEIAVLSDQLRQVKREESENKPGSALTLGLVIAVLLRLVIMAANILFSNRLSQLLRSKNVQISPNSVATRPKLFLVRPS